MATLEEAFDVVSKTFRICSLNAQQKAGISSTNSSSTRVLDGKYSL